MSLNLPLKHLRAQIACYELKGHVSPLTLKDIFYDSLKISKFIWVCMEVTAWQELIFPYKSS